MKGAPSGARPPVPDPLSATRSSIPRVPARMVRRPRLDRLLDDGVAVGAVVVSAPAGSGKTLLLSGWATPHRPPVAWLSVEPEDGDPQQFWARVLGSLQAAPDVGPASALAGLRAPPSHDPRFVDLLVDACARLPAPRVLVLDDLHRIAGSPAAESLAAAARKDLGALRPVIATRSDPGLPVPRLRLSGRLTEIRAEDLRFDPAEAVELLAAHAVAPTPPQLATLLTRTEGWAAGLRLAALSLQDAEDVDAAVRGLGGDQRGLADYFTEEVLEHQEPELTRFLLDTCVVRRVSAELADTLTGRADGRRLLARLERENLFVVALDDRREWYRYHHLFADLLRHGLRAEDPARQAVLHRRAAAWFAAHGEPLEAARHLRAAQDWPALARFVLRSAGAEALGTDRPALVALLNGVPDELVARDCEVAAAVAAVRYAAYDPVGVASHAARARELLPRLSAEDARLTTVVLCTLDAVLAWMHADATEQVRCARTAIRRLDEVLPEELPAAPVYRIATTTVLAMGLLWTGELGAAEVTLTRTLAALADRSAMTPVLALHLHGNLAVLKAMRGRLQEARREVDVALAVAEESGWTFQPLTATAFLAEALIRLLQHDVGACASALERGRACVGRVPDRYAETGLALVGVRLEVSKGDVAAARHLLGRLRRGTQDWVMPRFLARWCELVRAEILLAEGRPGDVLALLVDPAGTSSAPGRPHGHRVVLRARALLGANDPGRCLQQLQDLFRETDVDGGPAAEAWLLAALAHDRLRDEAQAQACLERSLGVAAPERIVRPFLLVDDDRVRRLLRLHERAVGTHRPFVETVLVLLGGGAAPSHAPAGPEPLTSRERSVLLLLPTMMSNAEVAAELCLSVNTVKVHLKSLYRKLGVGTRREAVLRARELGLRDVPVLDGPAGSPAPGEAAPPAGRDPGEGSGDAAGPAGPRRTR
ncbi:LuxR C-terminal-related transcriptional regulator [uncultured Kocuria sp.]|uniref:LuxR C-terminal-related transcriptional regulator n=1 Tax=uncultured Kocuria sp. TaxID=259305 RepID=UPI002607F28B|nr:LuxR C-terminal-related transcriptional regulator [uncultured Kocuria sp.]